MGDWYKRDGAAETPDMHLSALDFDILWIKLPTVSVLPGRITGNAPDQLSDRVIRDGNQCITAALRSRHEVLLFGRTVSIRGPDNVRLLRNCRLPTFSLRHLVPLLRIHRAVESQSEFVTICNTARSSLWSAQSPVASRLTALISCSRY